MKQRQFIDLILLLQEIGLSEENGLSPRERLPLFQRLAEFMVGLNPGLSKRARRRKLKALKSQPVQAVLLFAHQLARGSRKKEAGSKEQEARITEVARPRIYTREELLLPVMRLAMIAHESFERLLDLDTEEFELRMQLADAALAGLEFELLRLLDAPEGDRSYRQDLLHGLNQRIGRFRDEDTQSPWRKHFEQAHRLLQGKN